MLMEGQSPDNKKIEELKQEIDGYRKKINEEQTKREFRKSLRDNFFEISRKSSIFLILGAFIIAFMNNKLINFLPDGATNFDKISMTFIVAILFYGVVFGSIVLIAIGKSSGDSYSKWKIKRLCFILFLILLFILIMYLRPILLAGGVSGG